MKNNIYLYGASGHCKVIVDILKLQGIAVTAIVDDNPKSSFLCGIPVIASMDFSTDDPLIISIGNNSVRKKISSKIYAGYTKAIHPTAIISALSNIENGTVVMAGAIINAETSVGHHCIINSGSIIEHDCKIEAFVHISPGAALAGNVSIGEGTHIGIGATIIQGITIGKWATIGAGSVIIKDVPDFAVVVGNPGRIIKLNEPI